MVRFSDKELIEGIKNRNNNRLVYIYRMYFPMICNHILKNNGKQEDAEDIFQDAMIIIYKKIIINKLTLTCALKTYIFGVCRNLWLQQLTKKKKIQIDDSINMEDDFEIVIDNLPDFEKEKLFYKHYNKLNIKCRKLLDLFFRKTPVAEIAKQLNLSVSNVKTSKFRCKEELFKSIKNDPMYKSLHKNNSSKAKEGVKDERK